MDLKSTTVENSTELMESVAAKGDGLNFYVGHSCYSYVKQSMLLSELLLLCGKCQCKGVGEGQVVNDMEDNVAAERVHLRELGSVVTGDGELWVGENDMGALDDTVPDMGASVDDVSFGGKVAATYGLKVLDSKAHGGPLVQVATM